MCKNLYWIFLYHWFSCFSLFYAILYVLRIHSSSQTSPSWIPRSPVVQQKQTLIRFSLKVLSKHNKWEQCKSQISRCWTFKRLKQLNQWYKNIQYTYYRRSARVVHNGIWSMHRSIFFLNVYQRVLVIPVNLRYRKTQIIQ
jgi:hypothetical protein